MYESEGSFTQKLGIVVTGTLLYNALKAAQALEAQGIGVTVLHMPTIKPLDTKALLEVAEKVSALVTVEEHQQAGGLGGAVTEYLSEVLPKKVIRVGVPDTFGQSGEPDELIEHYGMGIGGIVDAGKRALA
jgi:transketolase